MSNKTDSRGKIYQKVIFPFMWINSAYPDQQLIMHTLNDSRGVYCRSGTKPAEMMIVMFLWSSRGPHVDYNVGAVMFAAATNTHLPAQGRFQ